MNQKENFSFSGRIRSLSHAVAGIGIVLSSQHNAWIHAVATVVVVIAGLCFSVSRVEWVLLILAILSVWVAESLNTAFELLCDVASPGFHPLVKKSKDVAAGAVLLSAVGAVLIGIVVFGPRVAQLILSRG